MRPALQRFWNLLGDAVSSPASSRKSAVSNSGGPVKRVLATLVPSVSVAPAPSVVPGPMITCTNRPPNLSRTQIESGARTSSATGVESNS